MASPDTAAALLTAQSIVIAALAIVLQRGEMLIADVNSRYKRLLGTLSLMTVMIMGGSFVGSIAYLHTAEYPDGSIAEMFSPRILFNATAFTFVLFVYIGFLLAFILYREAFLSAAREEE